MKNSKFPIFCSPAAILIGIGAAALLTGCSGRDDFPGDPRPSPSRRLSVKDYSDHPAPVRKVSARKEKAVAVRDIDRSVEPSFEKAPAPVTQQTPPIVYAPKEPPRALEPKPEVRVAKAETPTISFVPPKVEPAPQSAPAPERAAATPTTPSAATPSAPAEPRPSASVRRGAAETPAGPALPAPVVPPALQPIPTTPQGVAAVIDQAESYLRIGNFQSARAVLEPLVKAKNPEALTELGKTYDPIELQKFLVPPGVADPIKATEYYTEAARLGSALAKSRLERLNPKPLPPVEKQR